MKNITVSVPEAIYRQARVKAAEMDTSVSADVKRFQLSYWDACIIATAQSMNCVKVYSEDLQDGQDFGGLVVENPFVRGDASSD